MPVNCSDPSSLAAASACYCAPEDSQRAQIIYLLLLISGLNLTPKQLAANSVQFMGMQQNAQMAAQTYLMCVIADSGD